MITCIIKQSIILSWYPFCVKDYHIKAVVSFKFFKVCKVSKTH